MGAVENIKFWREFIGIYKELPELWQVNNEKFRIKSLKDEALQILLRKLREIQPYATEYTLKRKLFLLKESYRRELNRVRRSEMIARNTDDIYKPRLQIFDELSFLADQDLTVKEAVMETETEEEMEKSNEVSSTCKTPENDMQQAAEEQSEDLPAALRKHQLKTDNERIGYTYNPKHDRAYMDLMHGKRKSFAKHMLNSKSTHQSTLDDANVFSATWAALFRKLEPEQQMFANKAIIDVLYQGQLCRLDENSVTKLERASQLSVHSTLDDIQIIDDED